MVNTATDNSTVSFAAQLNHVQATFTASWRNTTLRDWVNTAGIDVSFSLVLSGKNTEK
jgi:hypothetical protein